MPNAHIPCASSGMQAGKPHGICVSGQLLVKYLAVFKCAYAVPGVFYNTVLMNPVRRHQLSFRILQELKPYRKHMLVARICT
jgi:hypothetical protein